MTKDLDWSVRLAAIDVAPAVLLGYATEPDAPLANGLNAIYSMLNSEHPNIRLEAVAAVAECGPYFRTFKPEILQRLDSRARDQSSWQMRRGAVASIGRVGQGQPSQADPDKKDPPDNFAVKSLLKVLRSDPSAAVRREVVNSLLGIGPVATSMQKTWKTTLEGVISQSFEKDKSTRLWVHVLLIRNDPDGLKGNKEHLEAIAKHLKLSEAGGRLEGCQALGYLGEDASSKLQDLIDVINKDTVPDVLAAAIVAVTAMPKEAATTLPILQRVSTTHPNLDVRAYAREAIKALTTVKKK